MLRSLPMALLSESASARKRTHLVAIDMGMRTTKAVSLHRRGSSFELLRYTIQVAPIHEKSLSTELMAEHLKNVMEALGAKTKQVVLVIGVNDCLLRHAEVPMVPVNDMRLMLKFNTKTYLQQDLPDYVFDCHVLPPRAGAKAAETGKGSAKCRVLVGGAKKQFLDNLQAATKEAGLIAEEVAPSLMATANAFEVAQPDMFSKEV